MVNEFTEITKLVLKKYDNTALLAFLRIDDDVDTWSMLYSSVSVDESEEGKEDRRKLFKDLADIVVSILKDRSKEIARIGVFSLEEHLVMDALKFKAGSHILEDTRMNGNIVHEAYITVSK